MPPLTTLLPDKLERNPPTNTSADPLNTELNISAVEPIPKINGAIGIEAPQTKDKNELTEANHGDPRDDGSRPNSSLAMVSRATSWILITRSDICSASSLDNPFA